MLSVFGDPMIATKGHHYLVKNGPNRLSLKRFRFREEQPNYIRGESRKLKLGTEAVDEELSPDLVLSRKSVILLLVKFT